jgi:hypothetical protein
LACSCRFCCRTLKGYRHSLRSSPSLRRTKRFFIKKIGQAVLKIGTFNLIMETDIHMASGVLKKVTNLIKSTEVGQ